MEIISIILIFIIHAVAYVALQTTPTRFLNRAHKFEQVDRATSDAIFEYISENISGQQTLCFAGINERKPTVDNFGKRSLPSPSKRRREAPRYVSDANEEEYGLISPTAAEIWTIPSHIPRTKSARILWYLNEFIPSHPDIDPSTVDGRKKLKAIALEEEKRRKPSRSHLIPVLLKHAPSPVVVDHLPPFATTTD